MTIDSPYLFDNLEPIDQLQAKPVKLIQKNIPSEHWNSLDYTDAKGFDGFDVVWNSLKFISLHQIHPRSFHRIPMVARMTIRRTPQQKCSTILLPAMPNPVSV